MRQNNSSFGRVPINPRAQQMRLFQQTVGVVGIVTGVVWLSVFTAGCATTNSAQLKSIIQSSEDPRYTEATIAQLKNAGADDAIIQENFALQQKFKDGKFNQREYEAEMGKLQVRMDANRAKQEKQRQNGRTALSILQTVGGVLLQTVI